LLSDYFPIDQEIKEDTVARKRAEYIGIVRHYFEDDSTTTSLETSVQDLADKIEELASNYETTNFKQIKIDVHRT